MKSGGIRYRIRKDELEVQRDKHKNKPSTYLAVLLSPGRSIKVGQAKKNTAEWNYKTIETMS